jgi:hypothetical protein
MLSKEQNERLTRVGPGTPMGDLLRRYWHPIAALSQMNQRDTLPVKLLGEDLVLYRDLSVNTAPAQIGWLTNAAAHALGRIDPDFESGAIGATILPVRFITLPGPAARQDGQQLMLSFWAWGENEPEVMANLDRTFTNITAVLRRLSDAIRHPPPATVSND